MSDWNKFFDIYCELGNTICFELGDADENKIKFLKFLADLKIVDKANEQHQTIVNFVVKCFSGKSKQILFQDPAFFTNDLFLFESFNINIAKVWNENENSRIGLWEWIKQLYVVGNICLHPKRKNKFLKVVQQLEKEQMDNNSVGVVDNFVGVEVGGGDVSDGDGGDEISKVVQNMTQMFGMEDNPAMSELMTDITKHMHKTMSNCNDPMELLQNMLSGDMSVLGDVQEKMEAKITAKLATGELTEEDFNKQQEGMLANFGGLAGLEQMASGLGLKFGFNEKDSKSPKK